jgi:hypothetical protein
MISRYAERQRPGYPQNIGYRTRRGRAHTGGDRSRYAPKETVMNPIRRIGRFAAVLAGLACAWLGLAAAAPAAFATPHPIPPPGGAVGPQQPYPGANLPAAQVPALIHAVTRTVVIGGMPGWQIALIAIGAALLAATVAVLADRARAAHRTTITAAA